MLPSVGVKLRNYFDCSTKLEATCTFVRSFVRSNSCTTMGHLAVPSRVFLSASLNRKAASGRQRYSSGTIWRKERYFPKNAFNSGAEWMAAQFIHIRTYYNANPGPSLYCGRENSINVHRERTQGRNCCIATTNASKERRPRITIERRMRLPSYQRKIYINRFGGATRYSR